MKAKVVRDRMHDVPFKPFAPRLTDGRSVRVPHLDFISISPTGRWVFIIDANDDWEFIDLKHILSIAASPSGDTNKGEVSA